MAAVSLKHNADTEARYGDHQTLLHTTAYCNNAKLRRLLVGHSPDIEERDEDKQTHLYAAAYHGSRKGVKLSLEDKGDTATMD